MLTARYGLIQSRNLRNASLISLPALRASRLVVSQSSRIFVFKSGSGRGGDGGPGRSSRLVGGDGSAMTGAGGTPGEGVSGVTRASHCRGGPCEGAADRLAPTD